MFNGKTYYKWPFSVALFLIFSASNGTFSAPLRQVWAVSLTEHQAMLDEVFATPRLLVLVSGNLAPSDATLGLLGSEVLLNVAWLVG